MPSAPIFTSTQGGIRRSVSLDLICRDRICLMSLTDPKSRRPATMQFTRSEWVRFCNAGLDFAAAMPVEREI